MKSKPRDAFTLAEMLVVVAIIMILATLLVPAVYIAMVRAKQAAIVIELGQLDAAMKQYKVLYKNYPPNFADATIVKKHIQQAFGRYTGTPPASYDPGEALVFWLQGYSDDPINPLTGTRKPLMQFDQTRLKPGPNAGGQYYYPADGQSQPYLYIHNASYASVKYSPTSPGTGKGIAYKSSMSGNPYINPDAFQIISAGLDGNYGADSTSKLFPSGAAYDSGDKDNITNFSGGALESKQQ